VPGPPTGIVAVLDTSVLVRAWRRPDETQAPSRRIVRAAGLAYDSFTSHDILDEAVGVLARPQFGLPADLVRRRMDTFVRASRQVFAELIPGGDPAAVGGDADDLPVLKTALAVYAAASEYPEVVARAREPGGGFFLVSENTSDFPPGRTSHGFTFVRAHDFLEMLATRGADGP
jgi:predicted nucleic acid-binding protein